MPIDKKVKKQFFEESDLQEEAEEMSSEQILRDREVAAIGERERIRDETEFKQKRVTPISSSDGLGQDSDIVWSHFEGKLPNPDKVRRLQELELLFKDTFTIPVMKPAFDNEGNPLLDDEGNQLTIEGEEVDPNMKIVTNFLRARVKSMAVLSRATGDGRESQSIGKTTTEIRKTTQRKKDEKQAFWFGSG